MTHEIIIFDILEQSCFQKYATCWVFTAQLMLYFCICVFVYLCMSHLVISVLISLDQELSENIWFVWSRTCYKGEKVRCHACGRTDTHTQTHTDTGK